MKNLKKKSVKTGCFQGLIVTSHLSILPIVLILALSPSPFLLHSLSPVLWSSFSLRQKTAQDPSFLFFFPLAATGFSYSKESLLQLMSFSLAVTPGLSCPSACGILVPLQHVGSYSPTRDRTCILTIARWIFNHRITREVPTPFPPWSPWSLPQGHHTCAADLSYGLPSSPWACKVKALQSHILQLSQKFYPRKALK